MIKSFPLLQLIKFIKKIREVLNAPNLTLIPGFVQTHVHLSQTLFRGIAEDLPLLDWLRLKIFPFENAHDENSLKAYCAAKY